MAEKEHIEEQNAEKGTQSSEAAEQEVEEKNERPADTEAAADEGVGEEGQREDSPEEEDEVTALRIQLDEAKDKYLRLYSEFENYRRRTAKEKLEMISTANEELMSALLPVLDDMDRAEQAFDENKEDIKSLKEGIDLISGKLRKILNQKGLKEMKSPEGTEFDSEIHEAITQIPAPKKKLKGKIVDTVEKGYYLDEKVIRYAKVVIGG